MRGQLGTERITTAPWNQARRASTRKRRIRDLRRQQLCNGFLLLFLSQGTPLLLAGDEFGNSQEEIITLPLPGITGSPGWTGGFWRPTVTSLNL